MYMSTVVKNDKTEVNVIISASQYHLKKCARCSYTVTAGDKHPNCIRHSDCFRDGVWRPETCCYCVDLQQRANDGSKVAKLLINKRLINMRKSARKIPGADWASITPPPSDPIERTYNNRTIACRQCSLTSRSCDPHPGCTKHSACCPDNFWVPRDCKYCVELKRMADKGNEQAKITYKKRFISMRRRAWGERIRGSRWIHPECGDFLPHGRIPRQEVQRREEGIPMPSDFGGPPKLKCLKCYRKMMADDPHRGCFLHSKCFSSRVWDPRECDHCVALKQRALEGDDVTYKSRYTTMRKHAWRKGLKGWIHPLAMADYRYNRRGSVGLLISDAPRNSAVSSRCSTPSTSSGAAAGPSYPVQDESQNEKKRKCSAVDDDGSDAQIVKFSEVQTARSSVSGVRRDFGDPGPGSSTRPVYVKPGPKSKKLLYSNNLSYGHEKLAKQSVASKLVGRENIIPSSKEDFSSSGMNLHPEPTFFTKVNINATSIVSSPFLLPESEGTDAFCINNETSKPRNSWCFKVPSYSSLHFVFKDIGLESFTQLGDKSSKSSEGFDNSPGNFAQPESQTPYDGDEIKVLVVSVQKLKKHQISPKFCRVNGLSLSCGVDLKKQLRRQKGRSVAVQCCADAEAMSSEIILDSNNPLEISDVVYAGGSPCLDDQKDQTAVPVVPFKQLRRDASRLPGGRYKCPICALVLSSFVCLRQHYMIHSGEKPYKCRQCSYNTRHPFLLKKHTLRMHGYKASKLRDTLKLKIRLPHPPTSPESSNDSCPEPSSPIPFRKLRLDECRGSEKGYMCPVCQKHCADESLFKAHYMTHSGEKPFPCSQCSYSGRRKTHLDHHILHKHKFGDNRGRTFVTSTINPEIKGGIAAPMSNSLTNTPKSNSLTNTPKSNSLTNTPNSNSLTTTPKSTVDSYSGELRPSTGVPLLSEVNLATFKLGPLKYECPLCYAVVRELNRFCVHYMEHSGEMPYKCRLCSYTARRVSFLTSHWKSRHCSEYGRPEILPYAEMLSGTFRMAGEPFTCPICSMMFSIESLFRSHYMRHSGERPYQCPECSYKALYRCTMKMHLRKIHPNSSIAREPVEAEEKASALVSPGDSESKLAVEQFVKDGVYKCPECEFTIKQKTYFMSHLSNHSGRYMSKLKCPQCPYKSLLQSTLDLHVQSLHDAPREDDAKRRGRVDSYFSPRFDELTMKHHLLPANLGYSCPICSKRLSSIFKFRNHYTCHSKEKPYKCPHCSSRFRLFNAVLKHVHGMHGHNTFHEEELLPAIWPKHVQAVHAQQTSDQEE